MNRNCTGHFIANLHFLNSCPGCAIRARLVKWFCKRFLPIPAKGKQSGLQCIVQQCIAAAVKVARNFTVLIQFQFGDIPTLYNVSIVQATFYCFLVCRTRHLMARHPRYKHRLNRQNIHRRIIDRVDLHQIFLRAGRQSLRQLITEARPRFGEVLITHRRRLGTLAKVRYPLYHPLCRTGNHRRVRCMVQIAVGTHLAKTPALAQKRRNGAIYRNDPPFACPGTVCKRKMIADIVQHKSRNILRILQVALDIALAVLLAQPFLQ